MSGQPVNTKMDIRKFREAYMATLNYRIALQELNEQANNVYRRTGQLPQEPQDFRSLTDKLLDVEKLKNEGVKLLKEITDGEQSRKIMSEIDANEVGFYVQNSKTINSLIASQNRLGVRSENFIPFLRNYMRSTQKNAGVSTGLQFGQKTIASSENMIRGLVNQDQLVQALKILDVLEPSVQRSGLERAILRIKNLIPRPDFFIRVNAIPNQLLKSEVQDNISKQFSKFPSKETMDAQLVEVKRALATKQRSNINEEVSKLQLLLDLSDDQIASVESIFEALKGNADLKGESQFAPITEEDRKEFEEDIQKYRDQEVGERNFRDEIGYSDDIGDLPPLPPSDVMEMYDENQRLFPKTEQSLNLTEDALRAIPEDEIGELDYEQTEADALRFYGVRPSLEGSERVEDAFENRDRLRRSQEYLADLKRLQDYYPEPSERVMNQRANIQRRALDYVSTLREKGDRELQLNPQTGRLINPQEEEDAELLLDFKPEVGKPVNPDQNLKNVISDINEITESNLDKFSKANLLNWLSEIANKSNEYGISTIDNMYKDLLGTSKSRVNTRNKLIDSIKQNFNVIESVRSEINQMESELRRGDQAEEMGEFVNFVPSKYEDRFVSERLRRSGGAPKRVIFPEQGRLGRVRDLESSFPRTIGTEYLIGERDFDARRQGYYNPEREGIASLARLSEPEREGIEATFDPTFLERAGYFEGRGKHKGVQPIQITDGKNIRGSTRPALNMSNYGNRYQRKQARQMSGSGMTQTQGVEESQRFVPFGKYIINRHRLGNDIVAVKRKKGSCIKEFPSTKVSMKLGKVLRTIVGQGTPSFDELEELDDEERAYLNKLAQSANISDKLQIPAPKKNEEEKMINDFEKMRGMIVGGNDNPELIKNFKKSLLKMEKMKLLPKSDIREIMTDLIQLGH